MRPGAPPPAPSPPRRFPSGIHAQGSAKANELQSGPLLYDDAMPLSLQGQEPPTHAIPRPGLDEAPSEDPTVDAHRAANDAWSQGEPYLNGDETHARASDDAPTPERNTRPHPIMTPYPDEPHRWNDGVTLAPTPGRIGDDMTATPAPFPSHPRSTPSFDPRFPSVGLPAAPRGGFDAPPPGFVMGVQPLRAKPSSSAAFEPLGKKHVSGSTPASGKAARTPSRRSRVGRIAWFVFGASFGLFFTFFATGMLPDWGNREEATAFPAPAQVEGETMAPTQAPPTVDPTAPQAAGIAPTALAAPITGAGIVVPMGSAQVAPGTLPPAIALVPVAPSGLGQPPVAVQVPVVVQPVTPQEPEPAPTQAQAPAPRSASKAGKPAAAPRKPSSRTTESDVGELLSAGLDP